MLLLLIKCKNAHFDTKLLTNFDNKKIQYNFKFSSCIQYHSSQKIPFKNITHNLIF
jgi:hypothetical protein